MIKLIALVALFLFLPRSGESQLEIPRQIIEDVKFRFDRNSEISWKEGRYGYHGSFQENDRANQVVYLKTGEWLETITEVGWSDLTVNVKDMLNENFEKSHVLHCYMIETTYFFGFEVTISDRKSKRLLLIRDNGAIVKDQVL